MAEGFLSLFSLTIADTELTQLQGLSVNTVQVHLLNTKKNSYEGPLLITHWGLSGPAIITLSAWQAETLHNNNYQGTLAINWLPGYSSEALQQKLSTYQQQCFNKHVHSTSPFTEIPQRLWAYLLQQAQISSKQTWGKLTLQQLQRIIQTLQKQELSIIKKGIFKEEFVYFLPI